jgi:hypothetical protein
VSDLPGGSRVNFSNTCTRTSYGEDNKILQVFEFTKLLALVIKSCTLLASYLITSLNLFTASYKPIKASYYQY